MRVSVTPGAMALTRTPWDASSSAMAFVSMARAVLDTV